MHLKLCPACREIVHWMAAPGERFYLNLYSISFMQGRDEDETEAMIEAGDYSMQQSVSPQRSLSS